MSKTIIPKGYKSNLTPYQTQGAIELVKRNFENELSKSLNLIRVSAPLFVDSTSGLNDDLNGFERPVSFDILETKTEAQIVHSLAKWKRVALSKYGFSVGEGLYTNMNAIRRDEDMDNIHSIYVDQWDWEKVIDENTRNIEYLKTTVKAIVKAVCNTLDAVKAKYPNIKTSLCREVSFVTTQQLEDMYPTLTSKEREDAYLKEHKTAFIMQIGDVLKSGKKHDGRAPDYDDWQLNGDIMFYNELLGHAFEISSMGIRVDAKSLDTQLTKANCDNRRNLSYHKMLLNNELPLTMGGGVGQSRLCMLLLSMAHIGEVQVSIWDNQTKEACEKAGVKLL